MGILLKRVYGDVNLNAVQDNTQAGFLRLEADNPFLGGRFIERLEFAPAVDGGVGVDEPRQVAHGLGRKIRGWWIVDRNADVNVWRPAEADNPTKHIMLHASAAVTISIWVF